MKQQLPVRDQQMTKSSEPLSPKRMKEPYDHPGLYTQCVRPPQRRLEFTGQRAKEQTRKRGQGILTQRSSPNKQG